ncbi:helix-turn-helix domain-containing protein [Solicola gregarius]|uniref:Helix-turn-helix transcriptional regulator n=1 Tax=Solicola gregarius TaxID=2908642 RepID=A0AA46TF43_9ACTN|nr:helix-turn-helix transcriptional regulator [Solicola gregarius]UYM03995.1 helix-turn-helix transcriptional regulator [Solicola gregarius]
MTAANAESNRRAQAEMYGEPLGDLIGRCATVLGLTQAKVAKLLGISAPMLSQLINAHRIKIGNPAAVHRLQAMYAVAQRVVDGEVAVDDAVRELEADHGAEGVVTQTTTVTDAAVAVRAVFRTAGSADDFVAAADLLRASHPAIASLLETYGGARHG